MTINFKRLRTLAVLLLLLVFSCRGTDTDDHLVTGGVASLKINFTGAVYEDQPSARKLDAQKKIVLIDPSTLLEIEMKTPVPATRASVSGSLKDQTKLRIVAYEKASGNYKTHKDYFLSGGTLQVTGGGDPALILDGGVTYIIVTYSSGTDQLPESEIQTNLTLAKVNYNDASARDFMYEKQEITPVGGVDNTLKILLKHKVAQLTTSLNIGQFVGLSIDKVANASLSPHYNTGEVSLLSGSIINNTASGSVSVPFTDAASATRISDPVLINANAAGIGAFKADVTIDGVTKSLDTGPVFTITPGVRKNLNINIVIKCGAYLGPNQTEWKNFMCHNLGADTNADPFIPSAAIHGAKYQWGRSVAAATQAQDQSTTGAIPGWTSTGVPSDSWSDTGKTMNDPCPEGYKVPSSAQWQKVIDNNKIARVGVWNDSPANYETALKLGDDLLLPNEGYRSTTGMLSGRGSNGFYWSTTNDTNRIYKMSLIFSRYRVDTDYSAVSATGHSVRCIKE
ncbi:Fibrobacter succinogenes major domain (Fib_succ_major) [Elizabethkingia miricola]|nr:Fibrobacter succinogenes major domain (Fib_succ_major) [Elizabethkingia miricola]